MTITEGIIETPRAEYMVDHAELMARSESAKRRLGRKLAILAVRFNPYGAGLFCAPSVAEPIKATRDPVTKAVNGDEEHIIQCYEHEIEDILAWVEPDMDAVRNAVRSADKQLRSYMRSKLEPGTHIPENRADWSQDLRNLAMTFNPSPGRIAPTAEALVSAEGERDGGRGRRFGIMPLQSVRILAEDVDPPKSAAAQVNEELAKVASAGNSEVAAAIMALVEKLNIGGGESKAGGEAVAKKLAAKDREIEELKAQLAAAKK